MEVKELKAKYRYCASVAYVSATLFRTHKFKVVDDKEFILKAFKDGDETILSSMENFYKDMLKNDRDCEYDIFNRSTPKEIPDTKLEEIIESNLTLAEQIDIVRDKKRKNMSKAQKLAHQRRKSIE